MVRKVQPLLPSSTLNERSIYDYEAIVNKDDGSYATTFFSTTTAAIYPIENAIGIPRKETRFPVKFIPGYEKNIVILYNWSDEGKKQGYNTKPILKIRNSSVNTVLPSKTI